MEIRRLSFCNFDQGLNFDFQVRSQRRPWMVSLSSRDLRRRHLNALPHLQQVRPVDTEVHGNSSQIGAFNVANELRRASKRCLMMSLIKTISWMFTIFSTWNIQIYRLDESWVGWGEWKWKYKSKLISFQCDKMVNNWAISLCLWRQFLAWNAPKHFSSKTSFYVRICLGNFGKNGFLFLKPTGQTDNLTLWKGMAF